ncbi:MAG: SDR family oxidoreductase [Candidatus Lokiarchaeota archaeon]|nr:SDR family oxidoreductase [Candidatus Lokiarchaeota archaeon]
MGKFDDKSVLICYAGGGIGMAAAELFEKEGATVIVHDDSEEKLENVPGEKFIGDLRNKEEADKLIEFAVEKGGGKLDVIVNNEDFVVERAKLEDITTDQFREMCNLNLKTIWNTLAAMYPKMKAQKGNLNIVNVGHIDGAAGHTRLIDYSSVKAGLFGLTKTVAKEWSRFQTVRCNAVNYGYVKFKDPYVNQGPRGKRGIKDFSGPLNPLANYAKFKPQDIAEIILFLASDASKAINAEVVNASGGMYTVSGE